jgi:hypothetical protein
MAELRTDSIFESLKSLLAVVDNEERRKQIEAYIEAARSPLERAVFDLLSQFAEAVNQQVGAHYQVTLSYRPGVLDADVRRVEPGAADETVWSFGEGDMEKITLRIPAELKDLATEAAAKASLSANSWFLRVLARALRNAEPPEPPEPPDQRGFHRRHGRRGPGQRLSGWVGPE